MLTDIYEHYILHITLHDVHITKTDTHTTHRFYIVYFDTGTTAPSYFSVIKSWISSECNTSTNLFNASLSSSSALTAKTFTYGESSPSMIKESSSGFNPASIA